MRTIVRSARLVACLCALLLAGGAASAHTVVLTNGERLQGEVITRTPDVLTMRLTNGRLRTLPLRRVRSAPALLTTVRLTAADRREVARRTKANLEAWTRAGGKAFFTVGTALRMTRLAHEAAAIEVRFERQVREVASRWLAHVPKARAKEAAARLIEEMRGLASEGLVEFSDGYVEELLEARLEALERGI